MNLQKQSFIEYIPETMRRWASQNEILMSRNISVYKWERIWFTEIDIIIALLGISA